MRPGQPERTAARGAWGTVEWAVDLKGRMPAREVCDDLPEGDRAKVLALFRLLAETGRITNREKFRQLGPKAGEKARGLWEFKSFQLRFIGDFREGRRFIVAHGTRKQKDELDKDDVDRTVRILGENDEQERKQRDQGGVTH